MFGCEDIFPERVDLTKIKTGSNLSKEWRWSAYCFGLREIAPIVLTLIFVWHCFTFVWHGCFIFVWHGSVLNHI